MLYVTHVLTRPVEGYPAGTPVCSSFIGSAMAYEPTDPTGWSLGFTASEDALAAAPPDSQWITRRAAGLDGISADEIGQLVAKGELELHQTDSDLCRPLFLAQPLHSS